MSPSANPSGPRQKRKEAPDKGPIPPEPTGQPPASEVEVTATVEPPLVATLGPKASLRPLNLENGITPEPPLSLTPAGVAPGGPAGKGTSLPQGTLVTVGALLLAAGGSWGVYYFLRPPSD